ncbi:MAG: hypothetical protein WBQ11_14940, partial [Isosphaeraceae bacterium]
ASARQLVRQDWGAAAPHAGRGHPGWPMAAHQLASAYGSGRIESRPLEAAQALTQGAIDQLLDTTPNGWARSVADGRLIAGSRLGSRSLHYPTDGNE